MAIIDAIVGGQRKAAELAKLRDPRIKAKPEVVEGSLVGNWRAEHLFTLKQSRQLYAEYQQQLTDCDAEIERLVRAFEPRVDPQVKPLPPDGKKGRAWQKKRAKRARRNDKNAETKQPETEVFDLRS